MMRHLNTINLIDGSADPMQTSNFGDLNGKTANTNSSYSVSRSSDSSSDISGHTCYSSESSVNSVPPWKQLEANQALADPSLGSSCMSPQVKSADHLRIGDFQSLCLTFPELTATQLQSIFEQCGNDFQRTIDRVLMTKWCNDTECKTNGQSHNNNDWPSAADYACNSISFTRSASASVGSDPMSSNLYNANNGHNTYEWRSNGCTGQDDLCATEYGHDYYYDQVFHSLWSIKLPIVLNLCCKSSCAVMSTQGNHQAVCHNWNYDYTGYWYSNSHQSQPSQGSQSSETSTGSTGSTCSYELNSLPIEESGWTNGQNGAIGSLGSGATSEHVWHVGLSIALLHIVDLTNTTTDIALTVLCDHFTLPPKD